MKLDDLKCKEVFIVAGDEDQDIGELFVIETLEDLKTHLKTLTPVTSSATRVFHGVVTPAEFLPTSLYGKSAFIICQDPSETTRGRISEISSESMNGVIEDVTALLQWSENANPFSKDLDIEDIFILYGYQLQTCITVDEDWVDEEIIEMCTMIGNEVETTAYIATKQRAVGGSNE